MQMAMPYVLFQATAQKNTVLSGCLPPWSLMLAYAEENHCQQRSIEIQNHPQCVQSQSQKEGWVSPIQIANIHAAPRC